MPVDSKSETGRRDIDTTASPSQTHTSTNCSVCPLTQQLRVVEVEGAPRQLPVSGARVAPDYQAFPKPCATDRLGTPSVRILWAEEQAVVFVVNI